MCFATLMLVVCGMSAQKYNEQVMVVAPYKPSVPESYKINVNPQVMVDTNVVKQKADVDILSRRVGTSFDVEEIKAAKVSGEPINKLYNGHIKAGIGNYLTPYLDAFYNSGRNRNHAYGIEYKHLSSAGQKLKDYTLVEHNNSTDKANAFGRLFYDKFTLGGELYFDREMVHMYGLNDSLKPADYDKTTWNDASKRAYTTAGFRADLTSHNTEPDAWFYKLMFDYSYWQSNWKMKQHNPHLTLDFGKNHQWFEQLDEQKYGLLFDLDFYNTDPVNADKYSDLLFKLQPYAKVNWGDFEFFAALKFNVMNDTMTSMTVNPAVEIKWHGVPNVFDVYLGLTGDVQKKFHVESCKRKSVFICLGSNQ